MSDMPLSEPNKMIDMDEDDILKIVYNYPENLRLDALAELATKTHTPAAVAAIKRYGFKISKGAIVDFFNNFTTKYPKTVKILTSTSNFTVTEVYKKKIEAKRLREENENN